MGIMENQHRPSSGELQLVCVSAAAADAASDGCGCIACQDTFSPQSPTEPETKAHIQLGFPLFCRSILFKSAVARATSKHSSSKSATMRAATAFLALVVVSFNHDRDI